MTAPPSISAVLPAFNEAAVIAAVVRGAAEALARSRVPSCEIIVVDDGSGDGTAEEVRRGAPAEVRVRVISHDRNRGYGAALRTGFTAARHEPVWLMDGDGQFDPADLARLLPHYAPDVAVLGYRERRQDPWLRRANHAAFFWLVRLLFGPTVRDVNCAFKLFPRPVGLELRCEGAVISTELVLRARRSGYRSVQVAVPHYPRRAGRATGADPRVVGRAFAELWRLRRDPLALAPLATPGPPADG
ncbi:MAG: glycosyltransferase family 2 protein [Candidatus Dormibacteria bacterium]